jgi:murein DD-endopeptidase MepM/ murein hydrolase activator NlpD
MMRSLLFTALICGCATTPAPPRVPFEDALREGDPGASAEPNSPIDGSLARFLEVAKKARMGSPVGAPMPAVYGQAWLALLDDAEHFSSQKADARWVTDAMRVRLQLETEFQTDAHAFGDVSATVAERVGKTLRALSRRIAQVTSRARKIDPHGFAWPVDPVVVTSPYGSRMHPIAAEPRFHAGVDLEAMKATPIRAAETGTVVFSGWNGAHGKQIELQHDAHWATRYSHLSSLLVRPGTVVKKGQIIGLSGETGLATGPHLHFELREDGDALDPEVFLRLPPTGPALISEFR